MIDYKRLVSVCFSAALVAALVACDKPGPAEKTGKSINQAIEKVSDKMDEASKSLKEQSDTMGTSMDDTLITTKVKEAIFAKPGLKVLQITVNTTDGVVTLTGSVDSHENSELAKETAGKVAGVESVNNKLVLK